MLYSLSLKSENKALDAINKLEAAIHAWKNRMEDHDNGKSPSRRSWSFRDHVSEYEKTELLINRAENLLWEIKIRYPNLPQTFLNVMKIQHGKVSKPQNSLMVHFCFKSFHPVPKNICCASACENENNSKANLA